MVRVIATTGMLTWMVSVMSQSRIIRGSERIIEPMIALAGCSKLQRIIVAGLPNV
jgi:hypothetical protein